MIGAGAGRLAVERRADQDRAVIIALRPITGPAVVQPGAVKTQSPQRRVIEGGRLRDVGSADGQVADHRSCSRAHQNGPLA